MKLMNADLVTDREDVELAAYDHRPRSAQHAPLVDVAADQAGYGADGEDLLIR